MQTLEKTNQNTQCQHRESYGRQTGGRGCSYYVGCTIYTPDLLVSISYINVTLCSTIHASLTTKQGFYLDECCFSTYILHFSLFLCSSLPVPPLWRSSHTFLPTSISIVMFLMTKMSHFLLQFFPMSCYSSLICSGERCYKDCSITLNCLPVFSISYDAPQCGHIDPYEVRKVSHIV